MRFGNLPPGVGEALLLAIFLFVAFLVIRSVRRRRDFAPVTPDAGVELPQFDTAQRIAGRVRRVWRDPAQGVWLVEAALGKRRFTFCAVDYEMHADRYQAQVGKQTDIALFALSNLAPGGVEAMKDQIKDFDKVEITPDLVRLIPAGDFANDHAVIGRVLSHRDDEMEGMPVRAYRVQVIRGADLTLVLELVVERDKSRPFPDQSMVHGSARLFGYLPIAETAPLQEA